MLLLLSLVLLLWWSWFLVPASSCWCWQRGLAVWLFMQVVTVRIGRPRVVYCCWGGGCWVARHVMLCCGCISKWCCWGLLQVLLLKLCWEGALAFAAPCSVG